MIQRKARGAEADALYGELRERLDSPDLEDEIDNRPVAEVIADICRDLGLAALPGTHPWMRRRPADVAALCARAARLPVVPGRGGCGAGPAPGDERADLPRRPLPVRRE